MRGIADLVVLLVNQDSCLCPGATRVD